MAMLLENDYFLVAIHRFEISVQKGKDYQGIRSTEAFEYENTISDLKCCDYWEKWKTIWQTTAKYTRNTRGVFR